MLVRGLLKVFKAGTGRELAGAGQELAGAGRELAGAGRTAGGTLRPPPEPQNDGEHEPAPPPERWGT